MMAWDRKSITATIAVCMTAALLAAAPNRLAFANAPSGQDVPPAAKIVDDDGNIWTIVDGKLNNNGVPDTATGTVFHLRYWNGTLLRKTCFWYSLATKKWPAGDGGWQLLATNPGQIMQDCPDYFRHMGGQ